MVLRPAARPRPQGAVFYVTFMLQFYYSYVTIMLQLSDIPVTFMLQEPARSAELLLQLCYNFVTAVLHLHYNCVTILLLGHRKRPNPSDFTTDFPPMSIDKLHKFYLNFSTPEFTNYLQFTKNLQSRPRNYFLCNCTKFFKLDPDFLYTLHKNFLNFETCKHRPKCYT